MTQAVDRRVLILQELESLLGGLSIDLTTGVIPAGNFVRNRNALPKELVPGIILLDADEVADPRTRQMQAGRQTGIPPQIMKMTPEIYVVLDVRKPQNLNVGEDLSICRSAIMKAILGDKTLRIICGPNGAINYDGCITDLARNRTMEGQMGVSFTFTYPWLPGEIVELQEGANQ
jgi:hypothetical protein